MPYSTNLRGHRATSRMRCQIPRNGSCLLAERRTPAAILLCPASPRGLVCSPPDLDKFLLLQIPLLYAVVPGAAEEDVSLNGQALDTVIVRGLKVVSGANIAHHALSNLKHLGEK